MRLIDSVALMIHIESELSQWGEEYDAQQILGDIEDMPTIDAVQVVRCGECKHWMDIDNGRQKHGMCAQLMPNWFCADGEPKDAREEKSKLIERYYEACLDGRIRKEPSDDCEGNTD